MNTYIAYVCSTLQALKKVNGINFSVLEATGIGKSRCEKNQMDAYVDTFDCV